LRVRPLPTSCSRPQWQQVNVILTIGDEPHISHPVEPLPGQNVGTLNIQLGD
jgi:hypothetical protein